MQDKSKKTTKTNPQSSPVEKDTNDIIAKISDKVEKVENILVALSNNPTVDELAAALGLTIFLDSLGKHATAIFSGKIPNALEFLKPEDTFEVNTNSLQDFIIALNKDKADHLRYKLDGDYVKVFITPYKTTLSEEDLEFSHGDFNVNLVIALNVPTVDDLDGALYEHGRIMHDATAINITTGVPGKFGEIEWSDPASSSISEMVVRLVNNMRDRSQSMPKDIATAFLTGIVAATDRFSNNRTTPATMTMASRLMEAGADQTLISENVMKSGDKATTPGVIDATEAVAKGESADLGTMELKHDSTTKKSPTSTEKSPASTNPNRTTISEEPSDPSLLRLTKDKKDVTAVDKNDKMLTNNQNPTPPRKNLTPPTLVKPAPKPTDTSKPPKNAPRAPSGPSTTPSTSIPPSTSSPKLPTSQRSDNTPASQRTDNPTPEPLPVDPALENLKKDITAAVNAGKNPAAMMAPELTETAPEMPPVQLPIPDTVSSTPSPELPLPPASFAMPDNSDLPPDNNTVSPSLPPVQLSVSSNTSSDASSAMPAEPSPQTTTLSMQSPYPPTPPDPAAFKIPGT